MWNPFERRPQAKTEFVDKKTGEAVQAPVIASTGEVVGMAGNSAEAGHMAAENQQEWKEAA